MCIILFCIKQSSCFWHKVVFTAHNCANDFSMVCCREIRKVPNLHQYNLKPSRTTSKVILEVGYYNFIWKSDSHKHLYIHVLYNCSWVSLLTFSWVAGVECSQEALSKYFDAYSLHYFSHLQMYLTPFLPVFLNRASSTQDTQPLLPSATNTI